MSKKTTKYIKALEINPGYIHTSSDQLYRHLQDNDYFWDSTISSWVHTPSQNNDPPSQLIKIRLWCDKNKAEQVSLTIMELMDSAGYRCLEFSYPYPCRPPKANDSRIYLTFCPPHNLD